MRLPPTVLTLALLAGVTGSTPAAAQEKTQSRDDAYFAPKLMLGLAGSVDVSGANVSASGDADVTFGGGLAYMVPLHRYFALGGQASLLSWKGNGAGSRNLIFDLALVPQGRLPITHDIEVYVSLPIGVALDIWNQTGANVAGVASVDVDNGLGFSLSVLAGARFALSQSVGVLAELGYRLHSFSHDVHVQAAGIVGASGSIDVDIEELALDFGVWF